MVLRQKILPAALAFGLLIGIHEGRVALWEGDDPAPEFVSDYSAAALPPSDQEALQKGIPAADQNQASSRMEDFSS